MNNIKVSIILPCYGVEKYLDRCMNSLINQTLKDIEIIMIDDKSPDNVPQMCDEWAKKDCRVKVIHKKVNEGLGLARNTGLKEATGKYIAFVDSDDFVDVKMYEILYNRAINESADVVYCNCFHYKDNLYKRARIDTYNELIFEGREAVDNFLLDMVGPLPKDSRDCKYMMSVWHAIYRKTIFNEYNIEFVSERKFLSEDLVFDIDYLQHCVKIIYMPNLFYYYCINNESLSHSIDKEKYDKAKYFLTSIYQRLDKIFEKERFILHFYRLQFLYLRILLSYSARKKWDISINTILDDIYWQPLFNEYPYKKMNKFKALFFFALKYKLIGLIKIVCNLLLKPN